MRFGLTAAVLLLLAIGYGIATDSYYYRTPRSYKVLANIFAWAGFISAMLAIWTGV